MATGDSGDQLGRLKSYLPPWFGDTFPVLSAVLSAIAGVKGFLYQLIAFAALQARLATASGGFLDLAAVDFFGTGTTRRPGQSDASFRNLIIVNLFRERATRRAIEQVLIDLTGREPIIFEPARVQDTGAYNCPSLGYGVAGGYGSMLMPYQALVTAYRPSGSGIPSVAGYGISAGGYSTPSQAEYASLSMVTDTITDDDIYDAVSGVKVYGTTVWVRIGNSYSLGPTPPDFTLFVGNRPLHFGSSATPIRLIGWNL